MSYAQIINRCWFFCEYGLYQHVLTNRSKECETLWKVWNICVKSAMFNVPRRTNCFTWNNCHEKMVLRQAQELTKSAMFKVPRQTNCFTWNNCKIIPRAKSKGRIVVVLRFYSETSDFYSKCFTWNNLFASFALEIFRIDYLYIFIVVNCVLVLIKRYRYQIHSPS